MESENETVAEIVSEMRRDAIAADAWCETHGEMASAASVLNRHADRIDAAHRREVGELREFSNDMRTWFRLYYSCGSDPKSKWWRSCASCRRKRCPVRLWKDLTMMASDNETVAENALNYVMTVAAIEEAWSNTSKALAEIRVGSSSKRNCDRFDDFSTAKHAWHEECFDYDESSGEWVNPKFPNLTFEEWLFVPCEEGGES